MTDKPKTTGKLKLLLKILGGLVLLGVVLHAVAVITTGSSLRKAKEKIAANGYPMTPAEIIPPPIPDEQNAAVELNKVFGLFTLGAKEAYSPGKTAGELVSPFTELDDLSAELRNAGASTFNYTDEQMKTLDALFAEPEVEQVFALLKTAAQKDKCYFEHDYEDGPWLLLPGLSHYRSAIRLLAVRAKYESQRGQKEQALALLKESLKLCNGLRDEPILVSQLVRLACFGISRDAVRHVSHQHQLTDQEVTELTRLFEPSERIEPFQRAMHGERILFGQWFFEYDDERFEKAVTGLTGDEAIMKYYSWYPFRPLFNMDYTAYLEVMEVNTNLLEMELKPALEKDWDKDIEERIGKGALLTGMLAPALSKIRTVFATSRAKTQMTEIAIAFNQYKHKNGHYPESMELAAPGIVEEATGEPFGYIQTAEGVIIFSQCDKFDKKLKTGRKTPDGKSEKVCGIRLLN